MVLLRTTYCRNLDKSHWIAPLSPDPAEYVTSFKSYSSNRRQVRAPSDPPWLTWAWVSASNEKRRQASLEHEICFYAGRIYPQSIQQTVSPTNWYFEYYWRIFPKSIEDRWCLAPTPFRHRVDVIMWTQRVKKAKVQERDIRVSSCANCENSSKENGLISEWEWWEMRTHEQRHVIPFIDEDRIYLMCNCPQPLWILVRLLLWAMSAMCYITKVR
jgi:hypothetical protein